MKGGKIQQHLGHTRQDITKQQQQQQQQWQNQQQQLQLKQKQQ